MAHAHACYSNVGWRHFSISNYTHGYCCLHCVRVCACVRARRCVYWVCVCGQFSSSRNEFSFVSLLLPQGYSHRFTYFLTCARFDFGKKLKATSRRTLSGPHSNTHTADYVWTVVLYANQLHGVAFCTPSFHSVRLPCGAEVINFIFIACPISDSLTRPPRLSFIFFSGPFLCYHESFFFRAEPKKPVIKDEN